VKIDARILRHLCRFLIAAVRADNSRFQYHRDTVLSACKLALETAKRPSGMTIGKSHPHLAVQNIDPTGEIMLYRPRFSQAG
jgi:hypothetical protein